MDLGGWTDVGLKDAKMQAVKEGAAFSNGSYQT